MSNNREEEVRVSFQDVAKGCKVLGSPFTARLCMIVAERLGADNTVGAAVLNWPGEPRGNKDALPLRLAGALHALVLSGAAARLKAVYPPADVPDDVLWAEIENAIKAHSDFILQRLQSAPQTNEVRRSAMLLPGFLEIAARFSKPIVLSEVGSSAGLNLNWDMYHYRLGAFDWGDIGSPVSLQPDFSGPKLEGGTIQILERAGCDLNPLDVTSSEDRDRMLSYIWADQFDRMERTRHAFEIANLHPPKIDKADAIDWLSQRLSVKYPDAVHVIFHTIAWQYLPVSAKEAGDALIEAAGKMATPDAPLARLALEADDQPDSAAITLQTWPTGEKRQIGRGDFHGRWIMWQGM
jgi:hypothetical protein